VVVFVQDGKDFQGLYTLDQFIHGHRLQGGRGDVVGRSGLDPQGKHTLDMVRQGHRLRRGRWGRPLGRPGLVAAGTGGGGEEE